MRWPAPVALEYALAAQADPAGRIVAIAIARAPWRPQVVQNARQADREPVPRAQHGRQHDDRLGEVHRAGALRPELMGAQLIQARARQRFHDRARLVRRIVGRAHGESIGPACQRRYFAQHLAKVRRRHSGPQTAYRMSLRRRRSDALAWQHFCRATGVKPAGHSRPAICGVPVHGPASCRRAEKSPTSPPWLGLRAYALATGRRPTRAAKPQSARGRER